MKQKTGCAFKLCSRLIRGRAPKYPIGPEVPASGLFSSVPGGSRTPVPIPRLPSNRNGPISGADDSTCSYIYATLGCIASEARMLKRNLLTDFEMALQDYSNALSEAQTPALTPDERIELLRAAQPLWDRIQAISRAIEQRTAGELHAGDAG